MRFFKYVFWVPVVLNLVAVTIGSRALELVSKPLLMPLLALSVFILAKEHDIRDRRVKLIVLALLFGALGDTLLMAGGGGWFISGMFAFLIGHILYFSVLPSPWKVKGLSGTILSLLLLAVLLTGVLTLAGRFPAEGVMGISVKVYSCAFAFLIHASVIAAIDRRRPLYFLTALGFMVFAFSDTFVAIGAFTDLKIPYHGLIVMSTYMAAQMLVSLSLLAVEIHDLEKTDYGVRVKRIMHPSGASSVWGIAHASVSGSYSTGRAMSSTQPANAAFSRSLSLKNRTSRPATPS